ncbi:MAG TPA: hypothetical protein DCR93_12270, partial [Cytophagales bacterium]|nr:hypothetical protein [Cytophagales bacterium]
MANYDSTDPRSFAYWGATHALPDADCYPNRILPNTPDALGWNTCPHMNAGDTLFHFLTWHRLLLEHFEAMVRDQSGDPTFALPYWDYENHPTLPQALQVDLPYTANTVLQITSRSPTLNLGKAIDPNYTSSIVYNDCSNNDSVKACPPNVSPTLAFVMDSDRYFAVPDAESFTAYLESGVHNVLHRYIGGRVNTLDTTLFRVASRGGQLPPPLNGVLGDLLRNNIYGSFFLNDKNRAGVCTFNPLPMGGLMGQVPSAGFDPVFWLHHSNIDRLWAMWEAQQQQSIPEAQFVGGAGRRAYTFFLPNGELDSTLYDPKDGTAPLEVVYEQSYNVSYAYQVGEDTVTIEAHNTPAMQAATTDYEGILQTQRPLEGIRDLVETVSLGALDPAV